MSVSRNISRGLAVALFMSVASLASAQNQGTFIFSNDPDSVQDPKSVLAARPNTPESRYLFVRNPKGDKATYIIEMRDSKGRAILASGKIELEKNQQARVKLEKTPPPPPPKTAAPVAVAPPAPPAVPAPEPPPGFEIKRDADGQYRFLLRLLDEQGKPVLDNDKKPIESRVPVELRQPFSYIEEPSITITRDNDVSKLDVSVKSSKAFSGPPAVLDLVFPPQKALAEALRGGAYRRFIKGPEQTVKLQANDLPIASGMEERVRFSISVDGFARAFIYEPDFRRPSDRALLTLVRTPAVRVMPAGSDRPVLTIAAKPANKFPVKIEVDNAPIGSKLSVRIDRSGSGTFAEADEVTYLPSTREERVFLDPKPDDESIVVNFAVSDWVHQLDLQALRGKHEIQGVLEYELNGKKDDAKFSFFLILDDTPPTALQFGKLPERHVKGTPLKLNATATETETTITQAVFFLGKPGPDGKLPDVKVEGDLVDGKLGVWSGDLPIPDKKGMIEVGVQFVNETGIVAVRTQKIELIDPPPPPTTGILEGTIELGGRGQPAVPVTIRDNEGKEKGAAVTNDKGVFKVENLLPGAYRVFAAKPDSGVGTRGAAPAQIDAGKTTKVTVTLSRRP
ncbi:MAG: carboxypeptidase-like regulatory domain-containing protein [Planctomycetes bacterium]|nr:carboxypeptidase-like regulatory domain-containing protein [Planctomycetota bacterium]